MIFKPELSPQNFHYDVLYPLYSAPYHMFTEVNLAVTDILIQECYMKSEN